MFDTIEILRRTSRFNNVTFTDVLALVLFKLPHLAQRAIPFTVLFGGMMAYWRLNRHLELVVARSSGISAWEFLTPVIIIAIIIGIIKITIYSPFASAMMFRFEQLQSQIAREQEQLDNKLIAVDNKYQSQIESINQRIEDLRTQSTNKTEDIDVRIAELEELI